nr:MAG: hypothetical protein CM15mV30_0260 [uncultured marine virus]
MDEIKKLREPNITSSISIRETWQTRAMEMVNGRWGNIFWDTIFPTIMG